MKAFSPIIAALLFAAKTVAIDPILVNISSPIATVCEPLTFTWLGGTPPYELSIIQVLSNASLEFAEAFGSQTGRSFTWAVDISPVPGRESLILHVGDAAGDFGNSSPFEIQNSTDHSCIPALIVDTPPAGIVCEPLTLSWSGGTPPYNVTISQLITANTGVGVRSFATQSATFIDWLVDIIPTTDRDVYFMGVLDGAHSFNESFGFNINDGTDHSCISVASNPNSTTSSTPVEPTSKSSMIGEGKILGIGLGLLAALLLLAVWRVYILRTRRRPSANHEDTENLGFDQKIPLSPIQKNFK